MAWKEKHGKTLREEMGMTLKSKILTVILTNTVIIAILVFAVNWFYIPSIKSPEHQERVEVAGKRIYEDDEGYITFIQRKRKPRRTYKKRKRILER